MKPWIRQYQPETLSGIKGQDKAIAQMKDFALNFKKQKKKAMLLYGPPGCGKTAAVHAIANDLDLEMVEVNASDVRNKDAIDARVGNSLCQMSLFQKGKIILLDEVDGVSGTNDRGGIPEIVKLIEKPAFPVFMTANDPWDKKFSGLRKAAQTLEFQALDSATVTSILREVAGKEGVKLDEDRLKGLARRSGGDLRAAINDLQSLALLGELADIDELSERNRRDTIIEALVRIFKSTNPEVAKGAFDNVDEDLDQVFLWIDENLPKEYRKPGDLARAYECLSKADVFKGRIRRWQHWRFMVYIYDLLSVGIAISKDEKYPGAVQYQQTKRLLKIWQANMKYQRRKAIAEKIAEATHTSAKRALHDTLPYVQQMVRNSPKKAEAIIDELDLDKDDVAWLKK